MTDNSEKKHQFLALRDERLAYVHHAGRSPGVLFCGGFNSSMQGIKARYLEQFCSARGLQYTRFDYRGHGESDGTFTDCGIAHWRQDGIDAIDQICTGPQVLVGSSMGAWIAILAGCARADRIHGLLTIAAAPDFTEELIWQGIDENTRQQLLAGQTWQRPSTYDDQQPYPISMQLVDSGRPHLVLRDDIALHCPVRLMHGTNDNDVPWQLSARLLDKLDSTDATLTLIKGADHRLSSPTELETLTRLLDQLV